MNTIIFDLDGTLLPLNLELFMKLYFDGMSDAFKDMESPEEMMKKVMASTREMVMNTDHVTNETIFMDDFKKRVNGNLETYIERFEAFYDDGFMKTKAATTISSEMVEAIGILKEKGYDLIIATNPLFPKKAISHRIKWAGLNEDDFKYVTCYEKNHYCKPNPMFYQEILDVNGVDPKDAMMVGNDVQEDLAAKKVGLPVYLIEDYILNRTGETPDADHRGDYRDFLTFVKNLEAVNG